MSERPSLTQQLHQAWLHTQRLKAASKNAFTRKSGSPSAGNSAHPVAGNSGPSVSTAESLLSGQAGEGTRNGDSKASPRQHGKDPTLEYLAQVLNDQPLDAESYMTTDLVAYQVIHNDLAELLGDDKSGQSIAGGRPPITTLASGDSWASSIIRTPPPEPGGAWTSQNQAYQVERMSAALQGLSSVGSSRSANTGHAEGSQLESFGQLTVLLVECAQAVLVNDVSNAKVLLRAVRSVSSSYGSGEERLAHYFAEALEARLHGTGAAVYTAIKKDRLSSFENLRAYQYIMLKCPFHKAAHHYANSVLLDSCRGVKQVHIIDYGIDGFQWPSFMQALANLPGGPPRLRITGIDFPQPGRNPDKRVTETGRRLGRFAANLGIRFEYRGFADRWENVSLSSLALQQDEVLAVSVMFRLRHLLDESVVPSNPRMAILGRIRSMNPRVFVTGVISAALNAPSYMSRFRDAIPHYYAYFDSLECTIPRDNPERLLVETEILGREVLNVVACEGMDRMERHEPHLRWQHRIVYSGFQQLPMDESRFQSTRDIFSDFHKDWGISHDNGWLVMGWKDRIQLALAAWQPVP